MSELDKCKWIQDLIQEKRDDLKSRLMFIGVDDSLASELSELTDISYLNEIPQKGCVHLWIIEAFTWKRTPRKNDSSDFDWDAVYNSLKALGI